MRSNWRSTMTDAAPWRAWLAFAAQLGIAPACFWRLSVREWRALASPVEQLAFFRTATVHAGIQEFEQLHTLGAARAAG